MRLGKNGHVKRSERTGADSSKSTRDAVRLQRKRISNTVTLAPSKSSKLGLSKARVLYGSISATCSTLKRMLWTFPFSSLGSTKGRSTADLSSTKLPLTSSPGHQYTQP